MSAAKKVWAINIRSTPRAIDLEGSMLGGYEGMYVDPRDPITASALEAGDLTVESSLAPDAPKSAESGAKKTEATGSVAEENTAEEG